MKNKLHEVYSASDILFLECYMVSFFKFKQKYTIYLYYFYRFMYIYINTNKQMNHLHFLITIPFTISLYHYITNASKHYTLQIFNFY
jgi:hypothetical protein